MNKLTLINQHLQTMKLISDLRGIGAYPTNVLDNSIQLLSALDEDILPDINFDYSKTYGCMIVHYQLKVEVRIFGTHYFYDGKKYTDVLELIKAIPLDYEMKYI